LRVKDHLDKISWSFANRLIYLVWGLINLVIIGYTDPYNIGLYFLFTQLITYLASVSDSFSLQGLIQFGKAEDDRPKLNTIAMTLQTFFLFLIPLILFFFRHQFAGLLGGDDFIEVSYFLLLISVFVIPRTFAYKVLARDLDYKKSFFIDLTNFGVMALVIAYYIYTKDFLYFNDLIISYLIGGSFSGIYSSIILFKKSSFSIKGRITFKKYLNFAIPWTIHAIFYSSVKYLDVYAISFAINTKDSIKTVGLYSSAKILFKVFEQLSDGVSALVYPSAIKNIDFKEKVKSIMTKSTSFILVLNLSVFIILQIGLADYLIYNFLPTKFHEATSYFKIMLFASLFLPFASLNMILTAINKIKSVVYISIIAAITSLISIFVIAHVAENKFVSLGIVIYYIIIGLSSLYLVKKQLGFPIVDIFRAIPDTRNFIKELFKR
jgi:O-antigen/teichoic acid export membrane protein